MAFDHRSSGLLLHLTSLPGPHGSGDLGSEAHDFIEFLADARQRWWQMLPVNPLGPAPGFSPYSSSSSRAGNRYLVALGPLVDEGLLTKRDLKPVAVGRRADRVDYVQAVGFREPRLRRAFAAFTADGGADGRDYRRFCRDEAGWLDDFALFSALQKEQHSNNWTTWPKPLRDREPAALTAARDRLADEIEYHRFTQFLFARQWDAFHDHAKRRGVGLIGDVPIFVALDSVDAWVHRHLFQLDRHGRPRFVTGCPPDAFCREGQRWNHPQYDWPAHQRTGFAWWIERFRGTFRLFDALRIDHFLGFERVWSIPERSKSARGRWVQSPGDQMFGALRRAIGERPIIAEDLGNLTPAAAALRDRWGFPGMRVLQFGFSGNGTSAEDEHYHRPHAYPRRTVAYTGTHDNDTVLGWFKQLPAAARREVQTYAGANGRDTSADLVRAVLASHADTAIIPAQDLLGLNGKSRMNTPGTDLGNWSWRLRPVELGPRAAKSLRDLTELTGRATSQSPRP